MSWQATRILPSKALLRLLLLVLLALSVGACATRPTDPEELAYYRQTNDPLEPMNRAIFQFNEAADKIILRPAAIGYRTVVPKGIRIAIRNFLNNLKSPIVLMNDLLQGEGIRARETFGRFMVNTILGIGGLIDIASDAGIPYHTEDFGQTLAVWGVEPGPYLVLPLMGPSGFRDAVGTGVDGALDPAGVYIAKEYGIEGTATRFTLDAVDWRAKNLKVLDDLRASSLDFYATVRSAYRQRRVKEISNGRGEEDNPDAPPAMIQFDDMDDMDKLEDEPKEAEPSGQ